MVPYWPLNDCGEIAGGRVRETAKWVAREAKRGWLEFEKKTIEKEPFNLYSQRSVSDVLQPVEQKSQSGLARLKHIGHQLLRNRILLKASYFR
jgi:hypothetical protein